MQPSFDQYHEGYGADLECPSCKGNNLHHEKVEIFERGEDQPTGLHVSVENGKSITDTDLTGNPSNRRHGLSIHFSCEHCEAKPVLTVVQHKGSTYVNFAANGT